jgi:hypothetical protein
MSYSASCIVCESEMKSALLQCYTLQTMETPQVKSEIVRAIQDLPEDATVEDAMERLYFLAKIERGLAQSESDESVSHDEIKARFLR